MSTNLVNCGEKVEYFVTVTLKLIMLQSLLDDRSLNICGLILVRDFPLSLFFFNMKILFHSDLTIHTYHVKYKHN